MLFLLYYFRDQFFSEVSQPYYLRFFRTLGNNLFKTFLFVEMSTKNPCLERKSDMLKTLDSRTRPISYRRTLRRQLYAVSLYCTGIQDVDADAKTLWVYSPGSAHSPPPPRPHPRYIAGSNRYRPTDRGPVRATIAAEV